MSCSSAFASTPTRPARRSRFAIPQGNIVTAEMIDALRTGLDSIAQNPHLKLITIEGEGPDFSFGASIPEHAPDQIGRVLPEMHQLDRGPARGPGRDRRHRPRTLPRRRVRARARVRLHLRRRHGAASACRKCARRVPAGRCGAAAARVGAARATRAIVTGESRTAAEWQRPGLVELVAAPEYLETAVERWFLEHLAPKSAAAIRHAAAAVRLGCSTHVRATLPETRTAILGRPDADAGRGRRHRRVPGTAPAEVERTRKIERTRTNRTCSLTSKLSCAIATRP